jgi:PST family polysaccharide transporter
MIIKIGLIFLAFLILLIVVKNFTRFSVDAQVYYLSFGIVIGQALFPDWFFQGIEKMKFVTIINILAKVIFTVLVFVLIKEQSEYLLVPLFNSLGFIIAGLFGLFLSIKHVNYKRPSFSLILRLISDSSSLFVSNFATMLYTYGNVFILGIFTGNTITGIYSSMEKLITAIKNMYIPFYQALYPWLTNQSDHKKTLIIKRLSPIMLLIGLFITGFILIFGREILSIIYNDQLITSYVNIFKILSLISIFSALSMLYNTLYFPSVKKYKTRMYILVTGGIFNLILSLLLVKVHGIFGITLSVVTTEFLLLILGVYYFRKYSG